MSYSYYCSILFSDVEPEMVKKTKKPKSFETDVVAGPLSLPFDITTHSTEPNNTKEKEGGDFFSNGKLLSWQTFNYNFHYSDSQKLTATVVVTKYHCQYRGSE